MLRHIVFISAFFVSFASAAQEKRDILLTVEVDMIKSDYGTFFQRGQIGTEGNYFFSEYISATGGLEYWTASNRLVGVVGARWYPVKEAFIRGRGLLGAKDFSIGGGWTRPLNEYWRFEAIGDIYFEGQIAIRAGISYVFRKSYHSPTM